MEENCNLTNESHKDSGNSDTSAANTMQKKMNKRGGKKYWKL